MGSGVASFGATCSGAGCSLGASSSLVSSSAQFLLLPPSSSTEVCVIHVAVIVAANKTRPSFTSFAKFTWQPVPSLAAASSTVSVAAIGASTAVSFASSTVSAMVRASEVLPAATETGSLVSGVSLSAGAGDASAIVSSLRLTSVSLPVLLGERILRSRDALLATFSLKDGGFLLSRSSSPASSSLVLQVMAASSTDVTDAKYASKSRILSSLALRSTSLFSRSSRSCVLLLLAEAKATAAKISLSVSSSSLAAAKSSLSVVVSSATGSVSVETSSTSLPSSAVASSFVSSSFEASSAGVENQELVALGELAVYPFVSVGALASTGAENQ